MIKLKIMRLELFWTNFIVKIIVNIFKRVYMKEVGESEKWKEIMEGGGWWD